MDIMIPAWVNGELTPVEKLEAHVKGIRHKAISVFLMRGDKVQLMILFRRREMAHQEMGMKHCNDVAKRLEDIARVDVRKEAQGDEIRVFLKPVEERSGSGTLTRPR